MGRRGKLTEAVGFSRVESPVETRNGGEGLRRKPGRKPDPTREGVRPFTLMLREEHAAALHKAAAERVVAGKAKGLDKSEVLRLLLDGWIGKGAKVP